MVLVGRILSDGPDPFAVDRLDFAINDQYSRFGESYKVRIAQKSLWFAELSLL